MKKETREEKVLENATVCFLARNDEILLGMKTRKIGKDCWNGYGGGPEERETLEECAIRELNEETGGINKKTDGIITSSQHLEKIAIVDFDNEMSDGGTFVCRVHFYLVHQWDGEAKETEEMITPEWFKRSKLPFDKMMPTDKDWLPIALSGKKIHAKAYLTPFQKKKREPTTIEYVESF